MNSVILISSTVVDLGHMLESYGELGSAYLQSPDRLVVEGDWGWFAIGIEEALQVQYSDEERERIASFFTNPCYAYIEYGSVSAVDMAINLMPVKDEMLIDNDHGMILPIEEVRSLIQSNVEWQTCSSRGSS